MQLWICNFWYISNQKRTASLIREHRFHVLLQFFGIKYWIACKYEKICIFIYSYERKIDFIPTHVRQINEIRPHAWQYERYDDRHFYLDYLWAVQISGKMDDLMRIINSMKKPYRDFWNNFLFQIRLTIDLYTYV